MCQYWTMSKLDNKLIKIIQIKYYYITVSVLLIHKYMTCFSVLLHDNQSLIDWMYNSFTSKSKLIWNCCEIEKVIGLQL